MPQFDMQQAIDFMTPALCNHQVKLFVLNTSALVSCAGRVILLRSLT